MKKENLYLIHGEETYLARRLERAEGNDDGGEQDGGDDRADPPGIERVGARIISSSQAAGIAHWHIRTRP